MRQIVCGLLLSVVVAGNCLAAKGTDVSFADLIAAPDKYDHKVVRLHCYLDLSVEDNGIYATPTDRAKALLANFSWHRRHRRGLLQHSGKAVIVVGTFHKYVTPHRHYLLNGKPESYSGRMKISAVEEEGAERRQE